MTRISVRKWLPLVLLLASGSAALLRPGITKTTELPTTSDLISTTISPASSKTSMLAKHEPPASDDADFTTGPEEEESLDFPDLSDNLVESGDPFEETSSASVTDVEEVLTTTATTSTTAETTAESEEPLLSTETVPSESTTSDLDQTSPSSVDEITRSPDSKMEDTTHLTSGLFDREGLIAALTHAFSNDSSNPNNDKVVPSSETRFRAQSLGKDGERSSALSGNEPGSGPSPDSFGPVHDIFPVVFPHPASRGRENFAPRSREDFEPLPSLERGEVSKHFTDKDDRQNIFDQHENEITDEGFSSRQGEFPSDSSHSYRVRTPKPGVRPMLMMLNPKPLAKEGGKRLFLDSPSIHRRIHGHPQEANIEIEAKGDNGQIKRIPHQQEEQQLPFGRPLIDSLGFDGQRSFNRPLGLVPFNNQGLDPLYFQSNFIGDLNDNQPQRRFSDFTGSTPAPSIFFSTLSPEHHGGDPYLQFSARQLPQFGRHPTIFHQPTLSFPSFNLDQRFVDDRRRPLTRDHFLNNGQDLSSFVTPREPNHKVPFGQGFYEEGTVHHNPITGRPTIISHAGTIRPPTNAHSDPYNSIHHNKDDSYFLRPMSPRPTTIRDSLNPSTFFNFVPSTQIDRVHAVTPVPNHHPSSYFTPSAHTVTYQTTPRPNFEIHSGRPHQSSPGAGGSYLPNTGISSSHGFSTTTFAPQRPIITTTSRPIISTPQGPILLRRPSHNSNRGSSRYKPPQQFFDKPAVHTNFNKIPASPGSDYSTQYHSGEHLSHQGHQGRPWIANDPHGGGGSAEKEYTYRYTVHSPSTGDVKSAHETKLPDGGVVGGYSLLQPDGLTRQVSYTADKHSGFQANVQYLPPRPALG